MSDHYNPFLAPVPGAGREQQQQQQQQQLQQQQQQHQQQHQQQQNANFPPQDVSVVLQQQPIQLPPQMHVGHVPLSHPYQSLGYFTGFPETIMFNAPKSQRNRRKSAPGLDHIKHRRTRSGCFTCRNRRVKVRHKLSPSPDVTVKQI
jgi:transcription initiation factor TFIID subunit TAF12